MENPSRDAQTATAAARLLLTLARYPSSLIIFCVVPKAGDYNSPEKMVRYVGICLEDLREIWGTCCESFGRCVGISFV